MIVTVTPNTGIDRTLFVPAFKLNHTLRATRVAWGMGAKATDVSWVLGQSGVPNLALGFAAGDTGRVMQRMLHERGTAADFVWVNGETRENTILVCEDGSGQSTITTSTLDVAPEHLVEFQAKYECALESATCVVVGGSLPRGVPMDFYPDVIGAARRRGVPVVFDSSAPYLRPGLEAGPSVIKPNRAELEELTGQPAPTRDEVYRQACAIQSRYAVSLIVTLGREGAFALFGRAHYWIPALPLDVVSAAGAGDAVLAGVAVALSRHQPIEDGLRLGFALAGAVLLTPATADFRPEDARRLLPLIKLEPR